MAEFLDLEAVESSEEEYSDVEVLSDAETEGMGMREVPLSGNSKAQGDLLTPKNPKVPRQRLKAKAKKSQQVSSDEEEEIQKKSAPARGEFS